MHRLAFAVLIILLVRPVEAGSLFVGGTAGISASDQAFVDHPHYTFFEDSYEIGRSSLFGVQVQYEARKHWYLLVDFSLAPSYDMTVVSCDLSRPRATRCLPQQEITRSIGQADLGAGVTWTIHPVNLQVGAGWGGAFFRRVEYPGDAYDEFEDVRQALHARAAISIAIGRVRVGSEGRYVRVGNPPRLSPEPQRFWQARGFVTVRVAG